ncbi:MAG: tetratricopeptide repeat protein, partial [Verrucomicrobiota bacterium]
LKAGYDEMRRVIREQEPQKPSTALVTMAQEVVTAVAHHRASEPPKLIHAIRGDLDWIVMKTLDKDRARRYETANGLAMDIQRHLDNEPVVARPPGNLYRFQKLVRRNRLAVVAVGMVAAVLVVGAVVSTWQAIRATRAEQAQIRLREEAENARNNEAKLRILAETETARSAQVAQFMQGMLNGVGPAVARGRDTGLLQEILDQTARRLDELDTQPAVDADLRDTLGTVYRDLAEYPAAADMHRQALDLRKELHGAEHPSVASTLNKLGGVLHRQRKHAEAEKVYREALAMQRKFLSGEYADIALTLNNLGSILRIQGKLQEAEDILREALAMRRSLWSNEHVDVAESLSNLGLLLRAQGGDKLVEAEVIFRETLEMRKKLLPDDHPSIADTLGDLGLTLDRQGKSAEAEKLLRESLVLKRKLLDSDHPEVVKALATIVPVLTRRRKYAEAEILQRELLALRRKLPDDDHPDVVAALAELASLLNRQGKHAEVEAIYREAIPLQKKLVGEADPSVATLLEALGQALSAGGKLAEAERTDREVLDMRTKQPGKNPELSIPLSALANSIARQGRFAEAESMFSEAISAQRKRVGEEDRSVANLLDAFGNFLRTNGHAPKAEVIIREAVAMRRKLFGNDDRDLIPSLHALFLVLSNQGKLEEAVVTVREEVALRRKLHGNVDGTANALGSLGRSLLTRGRSGDAEPIIREGAELGSRWSQQALGQMYATGEGVAKDPVEAAKWFRKAAERGETGAQYTLGKMYATGTGVAKDPVEAAKWFRKVAECDSASNLNHLAWNLATSVDTERDGLTAVNLAEKAVAMTDGKEPILLDTLAAAHAEVGQFEKAVSLQQEAIALLQDEKQKKDFASRLKLYQSGIPCRNPDSLATKVRELLDAGKFDEAEPLARQCLVIREQQIPGHWRTFNARSMLGGSLLGQKKPAEAEPFLLAGYEGLKQREDEIPAAGKVNVKKALQLLVQLYETTGRPEQASRWKGVLAGFEESEARKNSAPPP